jgi:hypothetical protein
VDKNILLLPEFKLQTSKPVALLQWEKLVKLILGEWQEEEYKI